MPLTETIYFYKQNPGSTDDYGRGFIDPPMN